MLQVNDLTVRYGDMTILDKVSFTAKANRWLMIVGPNGAGKSTILNAVSQTVPYTGTVLINGKNAALIKPSTLARQIGVLAQNHFPGYSFSVEEVVRLGRYSYSRGVTGKTNEEDEESVEKALALTGLDHIRRQAVTTLSGGELQRTFLAQLFAQSPRMLLLDEPTNHLDLIYQKDIFLLIKDWLKQEGVGVISVVHDLNMAKAYGTDALLLDKGKVVCEGTLDEVMSRDNLRRVYGMDVYKWMEDLHKNWQEE